MVKEYNNGWYTGWYLLGFPVTETNRKITLDIKPLRLLALDGIKEVVPLDLRLEIVVAKGFNPSDYFQNSMGIIRSNLKVDLKPEVIILETIKGSWIYDYIKEYPIHKSQHIIEDDIQKRKLKFKIKVEVDDDLKRFLMKYSDEIKVYA